MTSYSLFRQNVQQNQTTCELAVEYYLQSIEQRSDLNAFLTVNTDDARQSAKEADVRFKDDTPRPLEGMVVAIKDNISTKGLTTTCGSKMLQNFKPVYNATVIERIRNAGGIIIGKTNCDEFAMGSSNENSAYGNVLHPINNEYVPGGSSGGSAVAVAGGLAHTSLGSDTGGSIRQPAAFCGIIGFKPTYGRISRYGLVAFASSLDQIGPFANSIEDTALLLDTMSGHDPLDSTTANLPPTQSFYALHHHDDNVTVGVLPDEMLEGCNEDVISAYHNCIQKLKTSGYSITTVEIPGKSAWIPTYYILATAEASANLSRFDGIRYGFRGPENEGMDVFTSTRSLGFGPEVKRRIMLGTYVLSSGYYDAYYKKGQQARRLVHNGYKEIFAACDVLFLPTTPSTAFKFGEKSKDPVSMYLSDLYTVSANLAGVPAISIPVGNGANSMPLGMQLQAAEFEDEKLLRIAKHTMDLFA
ncbi:MAG: Asp-tRNA(Asn)/Glu-tRNA(Gln) amidotransferase subunit GatA [Candidatus Kapaibacterium sp.]